MHQPAKVWEETPVCVGEHALALLVVDNWCAGRSLPGCPCSQLVMFLTVVLMEHHHWLQAHASSYSDQQHEDFLLRLQTLCDETVQDQDQRRIPRHDPDEKYFYERGEIIFIQPTLKPSRVLQGLARCLFRSNSAISLAAAISSCSSWLLDINNKK